MRHFEITLPKPKKSDYVSVFSLCCLHIGHKGFDKARAMSYRDYILKTPDTYAYDLGDDIDNAVPGDEVHNSMMWESTMHPAEQLETAIEYWRPLAEAGKLLVTHSSNHWWRSEAKTGISIASQMNVFLNALAPKSKGPKFGNWMAYARIKVGSQIYRVHSWHGSGGASTPAGALNKCRSQAMPHHADIYLCGHFHRKMIDQDLYYDWPEGATKPVQRSRYYGVTGSFLNWDESYAERAGYAPSVLGAIKLELGAKRWDVKLSL